jgi:hypothetical protein
MDAGGVQNRHLVVQETVHQLDKGPVISFGNMPNDGGHLILSEAEAHNFRVQHTGDFDLIRRLVGADDLINGSERYCLWLQNVSPVRLRSNSFVKSRIAKVAAYRASSTRAATVRLSSTPSLFGEIRQRSGPVLIIPRHSSERRLYVPFGYFDDGAIVHDSCIFLPDATQYDFAILTSRMHMAWLRNVGGRLESRYRYSIGIVYNTFPWPQADDKARAKVSTLAQAVLDARALYPDCTLADLYDPDSMPPDLRKAHHALDLAVDKLYRAPPFANDRERVEHLFGLYEKLTANLLSAPKGKRKRGSRE